jgi:hypothetical protein
MMNPGPALLYQDNNRLHESDSSASLFVFSNIRRGNDLKRSHKIEISHIHGIEIIPGILIS